MASIPEPGAPSGMMLSGEPASLLDGMVQVLNLECFRDHRGSLTPVTFDRLGFDVARTFVVTARPDAVRGGHAHRRVRQVLFRASGIIDVDISHRGVRARVTLGEDRPAMLIEAGVWAQQTYVGEASTLIVFADGPYDPDDYISGDHGVAAVPS